ncbi:MAG: TetR/AcrR family transcriptional regulator [Saprospiraceae bacterium]|uniref:TetR/AcrR family transcriptional regulator n=1 Tax=Candidatus Opimibacter skivensis TaxID=2982028 RepID=A0A9D7SUT6_9BACT|nr:TetR/AcrR family transcriptional regulator [Candidatus Opimibacter skivensis]
MVEKDSDRSQVKLEQILTAAQKRFGHYGLSKTAMIDIANDIGMSKASLYYYFKDKETIFTAVMEREQVLFVHEMRKIIDAPVKAEQKLTEYVNLRIALLQKMLTLGKFSFGSLMEIKPQIHCLLQDFNKEEKKMIGDILDYGVKNKEFSAETTHKHAEFFIDTLLSIRKKILSEHSDEDTIEFSPHKYQKLKEQTNMFASIFIKGITA